MSMEDEQDLVPEDDAIIGQAFRRSLAAFVVIAFIVLVALWLRRPETHDIVVEETQILGPQTLQESFMRTRVAFTAAWVSVFASNVSMPGALDGGGGLRGSGWEFVFSKCAGADPSGQMFGNP